ncbi:methylmalonyl-CoA mutase family protein [Nocardioides halotolerans]|uniref:methylmalonyl-CoA mutase family protein n=1 Tax=Nocardioides halotolerans TaxID=433660 RepID=UPI00041CF684|nr:methylmalonyl-CoA mutase family protein [Nocardioides halotolerans]
MVAAEVAERGGSIATIDSGWMRAEIDESAWERSLLEARSPRVGDPVDGAEAADIPSLGQIGFPIDPEFEARRSEQIAGWRAQRDQSAVASARRSLVRAVDAGGNLMPAIIDAFRADLTIGEVTQVLLARFGSFHPRMRAPEAVES